MLPVAPPRSIRAVPRAQVLARIHRTDSVGPFRAHCPLGMYFRPLRIAQAPCFQCYEGIPSVQHD